MARIRISPVVRPLAQARFTPRTTTPFTSIQHKRYAGQDYGSGQGDPKGENPQEQGSNPSAELEHPGPSPPAEGQSTGGGPTKAHGDGQNIHQNASSGGGSSGSSRGSNEAKPKIHDAKVPAEESEEVRLHNEDMGKRHDRPHNQLDEDGKVEKGFWSGESGPMNGLRFAQY